MNPEMEVRGHEMDLNLEYVEPAWGLSECHPVCPEVSTMTDRDTIYLPESLHNFQGKCSF